jgi:hypothetical protein
MSRIKRVLGLAGIVVLALAMLFGCARLFWDAPQQSGWYIRLNVGNPGAKAIGVGEYEVTGLAIAVYDPGDQLLGSFDWDAVDGPKSYTVQVNEAGTHRIEVTHFGENNGEVVEASETAEFDIQTMVITVIDITPGAIGVIEVEGGQPSEPIDLTDYWDAYLTPTGGETAPPHLIYIKQTDSLLNGFGVTGSVEDSIVTMSIDDGEATFTGTVGTGDTFGGTFDWMGQTGTFEMVPSNLLFGLFELSGMVNLNTDQGLGYQGEDEIEYRLDFHMRAGTLEGALTFINETGLLPGSYSVISMEGPDPGPTEVIGWFFEGWNMEHAVESGTLTLTQYDVSGVSGFFALEFGGGNYLNGNFDLSAPMYSGGVVTITDGYWDGAPVMAETASGMIWNAGMEYDWGRCEVQYLNEDREVWLNLEPSFGPMEAGTFSVPDQVWVHVADQNDDGSEIEAEAVSGALVITSCQEGVGMAGYFEDMVFTGGTLSGSFEVSFQTTDYE